MATILEYSCAIFACFLQSTTPAKKEILRVMVESPLSFSKLGISVG